MKESKNIPELRFPGFEGEWGIYKIDDISKWASGGTPSKDNAKYWNGDIPWITASSMQGMEYSDSELKITEEGLNNGSKIAPIGSLLILVRGSMLFNKIPIGITTKDVSFNQDVKSVTIDSNNSAKFILYWFNAFENRLLNMVSGTGIGAGKLDLDDLKKLPIKLPTLPEQTRIASFLTAVDQRINLLTQQKEALEQYKKGVMQQLFSQQLRFKDENGNDFPDWEEKRLGEIAHIIMGQSPDSKNYNSSGIGIPLIQGNADILNRFSNPRNWTTQVTKECKIGDLILAVRAPVGIISKSVHKACIGRGVCAIRNTSKSNMEFLYQFLLSYEPKWIRLEQGSTFTAISGSDIKSVEISLPCIEEQQKIASFLSSIDAKIEQVGQQIEQSKTWKKGLLQKMFV